MRRFQKIDVAEPSMADAIKILMGIAVRIIEEYHKLRYNRTKPSRRRWSCRRNTSMTRKLPDKAIDVIDEVGASQMLVPENAHARK